MKKVPYIILAFIIFSIIAWFVFLISQSNVEVLNPKGIIAAGQRDLIFISYAIMFSVFIPVILIALFTAWKYRSGNRKSSHTPDGEGSKTSLFIYWLFLAELMLIFFFIVWKGAHRLDPRKPLVSDNAPITVQVVALDWKWLFIYPEQNIATVNFLQIPVDTPIEFRLTADAPMNSFWIPQLGGQIYAMANMETKIHLMSDSIGDYNGGAAEINGEGFSGMRFVTRASSRDDFDIWVEKVKSESMSLTPEVYGELAIPSENNPVIFFSTVDENLYNNIVMENMVPSKNTKRESEH